MAQLDLYNEEHCQQYIARSGIYALPERPLLPPTTAQKTTTTHNEEMLERYRRQAADAAALAKDPRNQRTKVGGRVRLRGKLDKDNSSKEDGGEKQKDKGKGVPDSERGGGGDATPPSSGPSTSRDPPFPLPAPLALPSIRKRARSESSSPLRSYSELFFDGSGSTPLSAQQDDSRRTFRRPSPAPPQAHLPTHVSRFKPNPLPMQRKQEAQQLVDDLIAAVKEQDFEVVSKLLLVWKENGYEGLDRRHSDRSSCALFWATCGPLPLSWARRKVIQALLRAGANAKSLFVRDRALKSKNYEALKILTDFAALSSAAVPPPSQQQQQQQSLNQQPVLLHSTAQQPGGTSLVPLTSSPNTTRSTPSSFAAFRSSALNNYSPHYYRDKPPFPETLPPLRYSQGRTPRLKFDFNEPIRTYSARVPFEMKSGGGDSRRSGKKPRL